MRLSSPSPPNITNLFCSFVACNTSQHCCYVSDALASPLQVLYRSITFPASMICQDQTSLARLAKWRVTEISEWQSGNPRKRTPSRNDPLPFESSSPDTCRCTVAHLCGSYLSVESVRACGCRQSLQVRVDACSNRFVFLDGEGVSFPIQDAFSSEEDWSSEDEMSMSFSTSTNGRSESDDDDDDMSSPSPSSPISSLPETPLGSPAPDTFISYFQFPIASKRFSLVDLALLLSAVQQEYADHQCRRMAPLADSRALMPFASAEVFVFLDYFLELDWRSQVVEYRRVIAKRFFDKRVVAWNTVSLLQHSARLLQHSARLRQLIRRI